MTAISWICFWRFSAHFSTVHMKEINGFFCFCFLFLFFYLRKNNFLPCLPLFRVTELSATTPHRVSVFSHINTLMDAYLHGFLVVDLPWMMMVKSYCSYSSLCQ